MSPDELEKQALYAAIAAEKDPKRLQSLLDALDRFIDHQIKRARAVPDAERR